MGTTSRRIRLASLRANVGLVSQDVTLFNDTVAANIAYGGKAGASEDEIVAAAKGAHAWEFIQALPDGLQHAGRRERHQALRRPAPAAGHRAHAAQERADPDPG